MGKADSRRVVGIGDQFPIASVTKTLQAAQIMAMQEDFRLKLDYRVAKYLPARASTSTPMARPSVS